MVRLRTILGCAALLLACACSSDTCRTARDCAAADRCVNQQCRNSGETIGGIGDSCVSSGECGPGMTCDTADQGFPNGMCTESCASGATCSAGACTQLSGQSLCLATCSTDTDCRNGYGCCPTLGNVCVPPAQCIPAACQRPIVTPDSSMQVLLHEPHHKVGDNVAFTVPSGTGAVSILQQAEVANLTVEYQGQVIGNSAVPGVILNPSGTKAYDDNDPAFSPGASPDGGVDPSGIYSYFGGDTPSTGIFTFPDTAASLSAGVPSGNWSFQVNDYAYECSKAGSGCTDGGVSTNIYDVTVLGRQTPPASTAGTMDMAFYIVADMTTGSGQPFNATTATTDRSVQRMVSTFKQIYANAGINLGNVNFYDVSAADRARFGTNVNADLTGPCDELSQMFTLSSAHPGNVVPIFLVQNIKSTDTGGGLVVGIDGTIPGPAGLQGTVHSGAAVNAANLFGGTCGTSVSIGSCGADFVAFVAAHETGHYLGLFHTTEQDGRFFDPLTDTAKCPCSRCGTQSQLALCAGGGTASNPLFILPPQCANPGAGCGGADNMMFWQLDRNLSQGTISSQQAAVMRLNPAVH